MEEIGSDVNFLHASKPLTMLAIGAHPDDVEMGMGATLLRMRSLGWRVVLFVATNGSRGGHPEVRRREQECAAKFIDAELIWGDFEDGRIEESPETVDRLERLIKRVDP